jgi:hypothetical protein
MIKDSTVRRFNLALAVITALFIVALHSSFYSGDPDCLYFMEPGANTDEGLYSLQIRNLCHGIWH